MGRPEKQYSLVYRVLIILSTLIIFLFSIELMGEAFNSLGKEVAESILLATSNPFIGLFIGLLVTALIQSSSTTTSMIVAMVASGAITLSDAVPMIMGANIGTTLTSTIVSLGYITKREEFSRAIAAGTLHDFFNILTVLILFPLEYYYSFISRIAQEITLSMGLDGMGSLSEVTGYKLFDLLPITEPIINFINNGFISIAISFVLLFGSIKVLSSIISKILMGESQEKLHLFLFNRRLKSFLWGILVTGAVQSSSVTTSLVVPFAATGKIKLDRIMPFILGANIGTTITAFIAAMFKSELVISIAITHLVINVIGVLIFLPIPFMRKLLVRLAELFGELTAKYRISGFLYIILMFFLIPFTLIYVNRNSTAVKELVYQVQSSGKQPSERTIMAKIIEDRSSIWQNDNNLNDHQSHNYYEIHRNKNVVFIDNSWFMINKPGFCWDDEIDRGKFKMCIEEIIPHLKLSDLFSTDSVYVYKKEFYEPLPHDSVYYKYYLSVSENLLVKTEKFSKTGRVIELEKLIEIRN